MLENDFAPGFIKNLYQNKSLPEWNQMEGSIAMLNNRLHIMVYKFDLHDHTFKPDIQPLPSRHLRAFGMSENDRLDALCKITCTPRSIVLGIDHDIPEKQRGLCNSSTINSIGNAVHRIASNLLYSVIQLDNKNNVSRLTLLSAP
jgi:hypothetical protein